MTICPLLGPSDPVSCGYYMTHGTCQGGLRLPEQTGHPTRMLGVSVVVYTAA